MFRCPHCAEKGIPLLRKLILSPGLIASCRSCDGESGIRYPAWIIGILPGSILMIAALFVDSEALEWSLNIGGLVLMIVLPFFFAPLQVEK